MLTAEVKLCTRAVCAGHSHAGTARRGPIGKVPVSGPQVGGGEIAGLDLLLQQADQLSGRVILGQGLDFGLNQLDPGIQPIGDIGGGDATGFGELARRLWSIAWRCR